LAQVTLRAVDYFMKIHVVCLLAVIALLHGTPPALAEDTNSATAELKALVTKVQDKLHQGQRTSTDLAPELKEFDTLIEKHKGEKTDETAQIVLMKAMIYLEIFEDTEKGTEMIQGLKRDYPDTKAGKNAEAILANIQRQEEGKKIQKALVLGAKFPDFEEKDLDGKPISPSKLKGKVLLVDFWATWCGPCVRELPNVLKAYEKHHDKGFEIIGISLDDNEAKLKNFIKDRNMSWPQYFDGKGWENKLAQKYGIQSIPATFLLDGEGKIIGRDLRGENLEEALAKALPQ
jgi:peroxiredoxin